MNPVASDSSSPLEMMRELRRAILTEKVQRAIKRAEQPPFEVHQTLLKDISSNPPHLGRHIDIKA